MEANAANREQWLELERAATRFLEDCHARYTPRSVRLYERALSILMELHPELPFRPEDLFAGEETRWSPRTQKHLRSCFVLFGRWAEDQCGIVVLQSYRTNVGARLYVKIVRLGPSSADGPLTADPACNG